MLESLNKLINTLIQPVILAVIALHFLFPHLFFLYSGPIYSFLVLFAGIAYMIKIQYSKETLKNQKRYDKYVSMTFVLMSFMGIVAIAISSVQLLSYLFFT